MTNRYLFILETIKEAGILLLEEREKDFDVTHKGEDKRDLLTRVDLAIDHFLKERIQEAFPRDVVYSEETGEDISGTFWSIDPIDGTSNFSRSIPHFAIVISYMENGYPSMGAIFNPVTNELFSFEKGRGAFLNGLPIKVRDTKELRHAYALLHIGRKEEVFDWGLRIQKKLLSSAKKNTNLGSSALDLAYLAAGRVELVIYGTMTTLDIAVATALVREAGGDVYSTDGKPIEFLKTPQKIIAASTKELFDEISRD